MAITEADLDNLFTYHAPNEDQQNRYSRLRNTAKLFAQAVLRDTPPSADQTAAIRKIREALMTANAAVALEGKF